MRSYNNLVFGVVVVFLLATAILSTGVAKSQLNQGNIYRIRGLEIGETIGDEARSITGREWPSLRSGVIHTREGKTTYNQYLIFEDTAQGLTSSGKIVFARNERGKTADYLHFKDGETMFEYEINFDGGLLGTIDSDGHIREIEGERFVMLGEEFTITRATVNTDTNAVSLSLIGGRSLDTLREGKSRPYLIDGKEYNVGVMMISDTNPPKVKFIVNGEITPAIKEGEAIVLADGTQIGVRTIMPNEAGELFGGVDLVEFYASASEIKFHDGNTGDSLFEAGVDVAKQHIPEGKVRIRAFGNENSFGIFSIEYRLEAQADRGDVFIPKGEGLREQLRNPGGMLSSGWDIRYGGIESQGSSKIRFDARGNDRYRLSFENIKGQSYRVPFIDASGTFKYGDDDHDLIFFEASSFAAANINENDYFVLSDGSTDRSSSHILKYESFDTSGKLTFNDLGAGTKRVRFVSSSIVGVLGEADLVVGGQTYKVYVGPAGDLAIDQNRDGLVNGGEATITIMGGGILDLGTAQDISGAGTFTLSLTTLQKNIDDTSSDEVVLVTFSRSGNQVDLNVPDQSALDLSKEKGGYRRGQTQYGALFEQDTDNRADELEIVYPRTQGLAQVLIVGP